jgi:MoxR-like ATPase
MDYPDPEREMDIVKIKLPGIKDRLLKQLVDAVTRIRQLDLKKKPCISESIDWAEGLMALETDALDLCSAAETLNLVCKYQSDLCEVRENLERILEPC